MTVRISTPVLSVLKNTSSKSGSTLRYDEKRLIWINCCSIKPPISFCEQGWIQLQNTVTVTSDSYFIPLSPRRIFSQTWQPQVDRHQVRSEHHPSSTLILPATTLRFRRVGAVFWIAKNVCFDSSSGLPVDRARGCEQRITVVCVA